MTINYSDGGEEGEVRKAWFRWKDYSKSVKSVADFVAGWNSAKAERKMTVIITTPTKGINKFENVTSFYFSPEKDSPRGAFYIDTLVGGCTKNETFEVLLNEFIVSVE